jgi:Leucine-rich repeat (LRR) protein
MRSFSSIYSLVRGPLWILSVLLLSSGAAHAAIPTSERQALLDLYASTNGAGWTTKTNWNGAAGTECTWYGVRCNGAQTNVDHIDLPGNNLVGPLPATINNLGSLLVLKLENNKLSGSIPSLAAIPNLWWVQLQSNQLSGTIPSFAANTKLEDMSLTLNQLSGPIPSFAANVTLKSLYLGGNQLTGEIPSFASVHPLFILSLGSNQLSGPIPSFATNTDLLVLDLAGNQLTGSIPTFATVPYLQELWLGFNQLSGPIPSFAANTQLQILYLGNNRLSGPIPSLGSNTALQFLSLSSNGLKGPVDASLGTLTNLVAGGGLDLRWNALSSANPALTAFLNSKQDGGDWQSTQTIPVTGLGASGITGTQVTVSWTPIVYAGDTGNYQVFTATASGGPYTPFATVTANKSATSLTVTGLAPGTPYFFTVQTTTAPHASNQNTVLGGQSAELRAVTAGAPQDTPQVPAAGTTALLVFAGLLSAVGALRIARVS